MRRFRVVYLIDGHWRRHRVMASLKHALVEARALELSGFDADVRRAGK